MLKSYLDYLTFEKHFSPHTIKSYHTDLDQLGEFLLKSYDEERIESVSSTQLRSWVVNLMEEGLSPKSVHRKFSSVRSFFKWLKKYHGQTFDPTLKVTLPKTRSRLPVYLEEENLNLPGLDEFFDEDFEGSRNRCILELLYNTGVRSAELISLKIKNVDYQAGTVKVLGKRNKERIIPVGQEMLSHMKVYEQWRANLKEVEDRDHFFLSARGKKLYPKLVYRLVNDYLGRVSTLQKKSPHVMRHTFATHMLNRGADINAIKELLGHESLAATQVYTHNGIDELINVYRSSHPRS